MGFGIDVDVDLYSPNVVGGKGLGYDIDFCSNFILDCNGFVFVYDVDLYSSIVVCGKGLGYEKSFFSNFIFDCNILGFW